MHAKARSTRGRVAPAANDLAFAGGAAATSTTSPARGAAPTRGSASMWGVGLRHVSNNRLENIVKSGMKGIWEGHMGRANDGRGSAGFTHNCLLHSEHLRLKVAPGDFQEGFGCTSHCSRASNLFWSKDL